MELSKQVTNLEISKRLKELGAKQESLFWWRQSLSSEVVFARKHRGGKHISGVICSAFTVAELGDMLPLSTQTWKYKDEDVEKWAGKIALIDDTFGSYDTEANGRGRMMLFLLESGFPFPPHEVKE